MDNATGDSIGCRIGEACDQLQRIADSLQASTMTDRDRFAMAIIMGLVSGATDPADSNPNPKMVAQVAANAYLIADAMLTARSA